MSSWQVAVPMKEW